MSEKIEQLLSKIINPKTDKSLVDEQRILEAKEEDGSLTIKYKRDGISPLEKREIEKQIASVFGEIFPLENIKILTISERSQEVFNSIQSKQMESKQEAEPVSATQPNQANLKVGHGANTGKRPVPGVRNVIAVASGKGGVGKSTFSTNLAITLAKQGYKVGLIDADIYGPSQPMLLGKRGVKPYSNEEKKIIPVQSHGIRFISFGLFIGESDPVIWRGPMLGGVLNQFLFDVEWAGTDYLIIDLPPGTGDIQLSMVQNTDVTGAIIISTPQDVALLDAKKGLEMFKKVNIPIIGLVENMSSFICDSCDKEHFIFGQGGVHKSAKELAVNYLGSIPIEVELREGADTGLPYMINSEYEDRPVWKSFKEIAGNIEKLTQTEKEGKGFFSKLFR